MTAGTDIGAIIEDAIKARDKATAARALFRDKQVLLRNVLETHNLVGGILTDAEVEQINEIAPPRKPRGKAANA